MIKGKLLPELNKYMVYATVYKIKTKRATNMTQYMQYNTDFS